MNTLTSLEKGTFFELFIRDGYVLNFSSNNFDVFTMKSVGVPLCKKYNMSKGKSLTAFINDSSEQDTNKLLCDLFHYYEIHYEDEYCNIDNFNDCNQPNNKKYKNIYKECKELIDKIKTPVSLFDPYADDLKAKFSSKYISQQIDLMLKMQCENPTEAIGKAKELVESCCKTILDEMKIKWDRNWDVGQLVGETMKHLKLMPNDIPETAPAAKEMKAILGNLRAIATNLASLRNPYGSGHGKSASYKGLEERHAKLAVGSAVTFAGFLLDTHKSRITNATQQNQTNVNTSNLFKSINISSKQEI